MSAPAVARAVPAWVVGRPFLGTGTDLLLIGGGLSLLVMAVLAASPELRVGTDMDVLMLAILVFNSAHFAASTVRLYTMPGASQRWPFLTLAFPLVAFAVLTLCIAYGTTLGPHFRSLYLTWSPYHYAAQAYGLALMYAVRAGSRPGDSDRRWLRGVCMLPFAYAFLSGDGVGLDWLLPREVAAIPALDAARALVIDALWPAVLLAPAWLFVRAWRSGRGPLPLISALIVFSNGAWWTLFHYYDAFVWASIFHGIQYLAIVMLFHVRDQTAQPGNRHDARYHALWFYAVSLVLGYLLFRALPFTFTSFGFGMVESTLMVVAAINLHHFVVDAFIWRFSKGGGNRRIVEGSPAPAA